MNRKYGEGKKKMKKDVRREKKKEFRKGIAGEEEKKR